MRAQPTVLLLAALAAAAAAPAPAAAPRPGSYRGDIERRGYAITFTIRGATITDVAANLLADCDRDGSVEMVLVEARGPWRIRRGRFSATRVRTIGQARSRVSLRGTVRGGVVRGSVRERQAVEGRGALCDTGRRAFTARRT